MTACARTTKPLDNGADAWYNSTQVKRPALPMNERATQMADRAEWEWFGNAGHYCCGRWCRFHLTTKVGPWLVSTVGEYVHPRHGGGSEEAEAKWLQANWPGEDVGCDRKYETMVFLAGDRCEYGCGIPTTSGPELDMYGYNSAGEATEGHMAMCQQWSTTQVRTE